MWHAQQGVDSLNAYLEEVGSGCLVKEQVVRCDAVQVLCKMFFNERVDVLQPRLGWEGV